MREPKPKKSSKPTLKQRINAEIREFKNKQRIEQGLPPKLPKHVPKRGEPGYIPVKQRVRANTRVKIATQVSQALANTSREPVSEVELHGKYEPTIGELHEFDYNYVKAEEKESEVKITEDGQRVIWMPQEGSQVSFMTCPFFEVLLHGPRGTGKTDVLLMDFAQHCERGLGASWRGIIFRQTYPQLADIVAKTRKWFPKIYGKRVQFNGTFMSWTWESGEVLLLRHMRRADDYSNYHGHEYPFEGWEELTNWADLAPYKLMMACCRSDNPKVPRKIRSTCNPYGPGHNIVRHRFRLPENDGKPIMDSRDEEGNLEKPRVSIRSRMWENQILLRSNPDYRQIVSGAARNKGERMAWIIGSWDITAGGLLDEAWVQAKRYALLKGFDIPSSWVIRRSFDWGGSSPFSVGWYAVSDGTDYTDREGVEHSTVRGDIFRIAEWYGWNGTPNKGLELTAEQLTTGIVERELEMGIYGRVACGPADTQIFDVESSRRTHSISSEMLKPVKIDGKRYPGIRWERADKRPGSRIQGWDRIRAMLKATIPAKDGTRERPGLFIFKDSNVHWLRTVPSLPRDDKKPDDADSDAEDHAGDETRYMISFKSPKMRVGRM